MHCTLEGVYVVMIDNSWVRQIWLWLNYSSATYPLSDLETFTGALPFIHEMRIIGSNNAVIELHIVPGMQQMPCQIVPLIVFILTSNLDIYSLDLGTRVLCENAHIPGRGRITLLSVLLSTCLYKASLLNNCLRKGQRGPIFVRMRWAESPNVTMKTPGQGRHRGSTQFLTHSPRFPCTWLASPFQPHSSSPPLFSTGLSIACRKFIFSLGLPISY